MNKEEERRLMKLARQAADLRACIDGANSLLRSWTRHKADAGEIYLSLMDRRHSRWHAGANLTATAVQTELVPVLKRIRDNAVEQLRALAPEIREQPRRELPD